MKVRFFIIPFVVLAVLSPLVGATEPPYPSRPIKLIVGFPAGGSTDLAARILAELLTPVLGQPVVVENRPGASGSIATDFVSRASPDGYTLLLAASSFVTAPSFSPKLTWSPTRDFSPISTVASVPIVAVASKSIGVDSISALVEMSRKSGSRLNLASPGAATLTRLSAEAFKHAAQVGWVTVNYQGGAPAVQSLLAGDTQVMFANVSDVLTHIKGGRLNALGVTTANRSQTLPDVPTIAESGYPEFVFSAWLALVGPTGIPLETVQKLNKELGRLLVSREVQARFLSLGIDAEASSPEKLGRFISSETERVGKIVEALGEVAR